MIETQRQILDLSSQQERLQKIDLPRDVSVAVYRTIDATFTTGVAQAINFNAERYDTDGFHDNVTNNSRLTAPYSGKYGVAATIRWAANATGQRNLRLVVNGATTIALVAVDATAAGNTDMCIYREYELAAGDYVEVIVVQNSGGNLNVTAVGDCSPEATMRLVG